MKKLFIIICLSLASCTNNKEGFIAEKEFIIDVAKEQTDVNFEDLSDSLYLVPLETIKESLIAEVTKLIIDDDLIFVFDIRNQRILKFDMDGKFICQIGMKGRSRREYGFFNDIYIDKENNVIYAYERYKQVMQCYNYEGELIEIMPCAIAFNSFTKVGDNFWVYSCFVTEDGDRYNLTCLDSTLTEIISQHFPQTNNFVRAAFYPTFSEDEDGNAYFYYPMSDGIYHVGESNVELVYNFNFGDRTMPYDLLQGIDDYLEYDKVLQAKYLGNLSYLMFYKNYMFVNFQETNMGVMKRYNFCYDIDEDQEYILRYMPNQESINCIDVKGSYNGYLFSTLSYVRDYAILKDRFNITASASDNPIIIFYRVVESIQ